MLVALPNNTILTSDTTLYCVTENNDILQVKWSYVDLAGTRSVLTSITNTGVSILHVFTNQPGYYTCEVTENGGNSTTYTAEVRSDNTNNTGMFSLSILFIK